MKIFIYGDSNTWGQIPNKNEYSMQNIPLRFPKKLIWWSKLLEHNEVKVNCNPSRTILDELNTNKLTEISILNNYDLIIIQLGKNDCKTQYNQTAKQIAKNLEKLAENLEQKTNSSILIISPSLKPKLAISQNSYKDGKQKTIMLDYYYQQIAKKHGFLFVSGMNAELGADGEHLTCCGHKTIASRVIDEIFTLEEEASIIR